MDSKFIPFRLEADINFFEGTEELRKEVSSIVKFPENKTPDMLFFSGIFLSSGENLNKAFFMPSELVKAHATIDNKALDIEHDETQIVGHIYSSAFVNRDGNKLEIADLQKIPVVELDKMEIDVMIAGILYKSRFPELAQEVKDHKWKLSMETYFQNFDIKIGNLILSQKEAEALGLASESVLGRIARVFKKGTEIAKGHIARVLRELMFSGCGLVKNPANPRSLILEVANKQVEIINNEEIIVHLDSKNGLETVMDKTKAQTFNSPSGDPGGIGPYEVRQQTSVGICVSYKKQVIDATFNGPDAKVLHEDWCALYEQACTSPSRGADNPKCLRKTIPAQARDMASIKLDEIDKQGRRGAFLNQLKSLLDRI